MNHNARPLNYPNLLDAVQPARMEEASILVNPHDEKRFITWLRNYTEPHHIHPSFMGIPIITTIGCPAGKIILASSNPMRIAVLNLGEQE